MGYMSLKPLYLSTYNSRYLIVDIIKGAATVIVLIVVVIVLVVVVLVVFLLKEA